MLTVVICVGLWAESWCFKVLLSANYPQACLPERSTYYIRQATDRLKSHVGLASLLYHIGSLKLLWGK